MSKYYKNKYDVVIVGGALAGMASALKLNQAGVKDILILEQHNLPGGVATSFVRNGVEYEASLHEMMSIGENGRCSVGNFFNEFNIDIDWLRVPEAYRFITPDIDVTIHASTNGNFEVPAKEIAEACSDKDGTIFKNVLSFLSVCLKVHDASEYVTLHKCSKLEMIFKFPELVKTAGYSTKEVMDAFHLPKVAQDILSAYWIYVGNKIDDLPFNVYGYLLADYLGYGSYIPKNTSFEMALKMANKCEENGIKIEYGQKIKKILVKNGKAIGVLLENDEQMLANVVLSGAYPSTVYSKMIDKNEVPSKAIQYVNSRRTSLSCFSVTVLLDATPDKFNLNGYSIFYSPKSFDMNRIWNNLKELESLDYLTTVCMNFANPSAVPEGKTLYTMVVLPRPEAWKNVTETNYFQTKYKLADQIIEIESKRLGVNLKEHIENCIIESPISIAHYVGAFQGSIYGYKHAMNDSVVARNFMEDDECYIDGLFFTGAHQLMGDGMAPCIGNGEHAATQVLKYLKSKRSAK